MIDPETEELILLREALKLFPMRRRKSRDDPSGERTTVGYATALNWCIHGDENGSRLDNLLLGGHRYTSRAAIGRFLRATAERQAHQPRTRRGSRKAVTTER
jgi:hypothetical protein